MAHRNRWFTELFIAWVDFPWQTVSHNQMVTPCMLMSMVNICEHDDSAMDSDPIFRQTQMESNKGVRPIWLRLEHFSPRLSALFVLGYLVRNKKNRCVWKWISDTLQPLPFYLENDESRQIREKATCSIPKTWNVYETSVLWIKRPLLNPPAKTGVVLDPAF
jgi:hypothetical protein